MTDSEPQWLSAEQLASWRAFMVMLSALPGALGQQLQRDSALSFTEYYVLAGLSDAPGRAMRMSRLAVFANAELSRLSHMVSRLEKRGFVTRQPDPADGRFTNAVLTDAGFAHLAEAAPGHVALVRELVIDALTPEQLRALRDISTTVTARLDPSCLPDRRPTPPSA